MVGFGKYYRVDVEKSGFEVVVTPWRHVLIALLLRTVVLWALRSQDTFSLIGGVSSFRGRCRSCKFAPRLLPSIHTAVRHFNLINADPACGNRYLYPAVNQTAAITLVQAYDLV